MIISEQNLDIPTLTDALQHIYISGVWIIPYKTLQWRHNERNGVSHHRRLDCLLNRMFMRRSKKTSKLRVTGLCEGNSPVTGEFPAQGPVTRKMLPFDDAIKIVPHRVHFQKRNTRMPLAPTPEPETLVARRGTWDPRSGLFGTVWSSTGMSNMNTPYIAMFLPKTSHLTRHSRPMSAVCHAFPEFGLPHILILFVTWYTCIYT